MTDIHSLTGVWFDGHPYFCRQKAELIDCKTIKGEVSPNNNVDGWAESNFRNPTVKF